MIQKSYQYVFTFFEFTFSTVSLLTTLTFRINENKFDLAKKLPKIRKICIERKIIVKIY